MATKRTLKDYMTTAQRTELGRSPTRHSICLKLFGVARPGKTARDRAKRENRG